MESSLLQQSNLLMQPLQESSGSSVSPSSGAPSKKVKIPRSGVHDEITVTTVPGKNGSVTSGQGTSMEDSIIKAQRREKLYDMFNCQIHLPT